MRGEVQGAQRRRLRDTHLDHGRVGAGAEQCAQGLGHPGVAVDIADDRHDAAAGAAVEEAVDQGGRGVAAASPV